MSTSRDAMKDASVNESFVERWLIMPKILFFLLNMFGYAFYGLMPIFFVDQWHLSYHVYGYASSVVGTSFLGAMLWSHLADRTGRYKSIIISTAIIYTFVAFALLFPQWLPKSDAFRYPFVLIALSLFNFFLSASFPLLDAQILGILATKPHVTKEQFNNQRLFGAFGHLAATMCSLFLYDGKNANAQAIYMGIIAVVFCLAVWFGVPDEKPLKDARGNAGKNDNPQVKVGDDLAAPKHPILVLLSNANFVFFMVFIGFSGIVRAVSSNFQKIIAHHITKRNTFLTASIDIGRCASEVFVFLTAKHMKRILGVYWVLVFSQIVGILRLWGYGLVNIRAKTALTTAILLELLKGFNSGLVSSSAIPIASSLAPLGCESSAQGLHAGNYSGLSMAIGGIIGGAILHLLYGHDTEIANCQRMFSWISISALFVTLLLMTKYIFVDRVMGLPGFPRRV